MTPGTKFVSLGGAIANDIHGKNHHKVGSFGIFVRRLMLLRSNGERLECSLQSNSELFKATIGGIGLTGLILWAEIELKQIESAYLSVESVQFRSLNEFFELSQGEDDLHEYSVAWFDCVASGASFGRGIFMRGRHAQELELPEKLRNSLQDPHGCYRDPRFLIPCDAPSLLLNPLSIKIFNSLYFHKERSPRTTRLVHYDSYFYPLDSVADWNRLYGKAGLFQFQCVLPLEPQNKPLRELLKLVVESKRGSFLAVLKEFGAQESPGMLSFPRAGMTLALDFKNEGERTLTLLKRMDQMVFEAGGAVYSAKDACMDPKHFPKYYPKLAEFKRYKDERFSSSLWRRLVESN